MSAEAMSVEGTLYFTRTDAEVLRVALDYWRTFAQFGPNRYDPATLERLRKVLWTLERAR